MRDLAIRTQFKIEIIIDDHCLIMWEIWVSIWSQRNVARSSSPIQMPKTWIGSLGARILAPEKVCPPINCRSKHSERKRSGLTGLISVLLRLNIELMAYKDQLSSSLTESIESEWDRNRLKSSAYAVILTEGSPCVLRPWR